MSDIFKAKDCHCQFCKDYTRLSDVLPKLCEEDQAWLRSLTETHWQVCEDLDLTKNLKVPKLKAEIARLKVDVAKLGLFNHGLLAYNDELKAENSRLRDALVEIHNRTMRGSAYGFINEMAKEALASPPKEEKPI